MNSRSTDFTISTWQTTERGNFLFVQFGFFERNRSWHCLINLVLFILWQGFPKEDSVGHYLSQQESKQKPILLLKFITLKYCYYDDKPFWNWLFIFMDILIVFKSEAKQSHLWISSFVKCSSLKTECLINGREEANKVGWHLAPKLGAPGSEGRRLPNIGCPTSLCS